MATIPESFIIDISIARRDLQQGVEGFGIVNIVGTSEIIPLNERIRFYFSIDEVEEDFGSSAEEFKAAEFFFSQNPRPQKLAISRRVLADTSGIMEGNAITALIGDFSDLTDGEFNVTIDGVSLDITGLDFAGALTFGDVATIIQNALNAETPPGYASAVVSYDIASGKFKITSGTVGTSSTVSYLASVSGGSGTDISGSSFLNMQSGLIIDGETAGSIVDQLTKISDKSDDWYWLTFTNELRDVSEVLDVAEYIEAKLKLYFTTSNNIDSYNSGISTDIGSLVKQSGYARTSVACYSSYPEQYPEVSLAARMAAVDFYAPDSVITAAYKNLPGVTAENLTSNQLKALNDKYIGALVVMGGRRVYFEGKTGSGEYIDIINNTDWLEVDMRSEVFNLIVDSNKVPFDDLGIQKIGAAMTRSLNRGVFNGMLAGGFDDDGNTIPAFKVTLPRSFDVPAVDKAARLLRGVIFTGTYSGAIHFVRISGTLSVEL